MITKYYIILQVKVIKMSIFLLTATYNGETIKIFALFHKDKNLIEKFCLIFLYLSISLIKIAEFHSLHKCTQKADRIIYRDQNFHIQRKFDLIVQRR